MIFSSLKRAYGKELANIASYDDAADVKKIRCVRVYKKAMEESMTTINFRLGSSVAGLRPFYPRSILRSHLVLRDIPKVIVTPKCPKLTALKRKNIAKYQINSTPITPRQVKNHIMEISSDSSDRTLQLLFNKITKYFDKNTVQLV